ncbi:selenocysteine-specific translation elongation factor [Pseudogulbenkiania subflava]|uniref:Selenocysteine-specific translation elongation factor SelB n=1 Tax=Pseudogulbenkiania subflava DSM 22618 TaxID=1123014 RepID=A0A1Y6CCX7_9NEIS|nr:selenocysteine-specific translation elongation factor [Pseudogulbenkiania subflava]SMF48764.1 selenocysteine-specific translation elongation factor SelB [Pseudogulbenkiania subflava DSM 22618]
MIIGTAGHVDHGKTSLIARLTGTDADRLPEEKRRGMTIDLGYAYLALPDGRRLGFIDVPGHEHFLANMLAGVGGIDHALLVIAADDGIMPQTVEHLAILHLLDIPAASIALTKCDLVAPERVASVAGAVAALLAPTRFAGSSVWAVSSKSGAGLDALASHLQQLPAPPTEARARRFRLAIDRRFTVRGAGLVVTGTALAGQVRVGDTLWLTGVSKPVRVRGIHAQNQAAEQGEAHQRLALNLSGDLACDDVARGDWLLALEPPEPSSRVTVHLQADLALKRPLAHWQAVHLHHAASHITGRLALLDPPRLDAGQCGLAELVFDGALHLADNDRLIVRDASAQSTLASARVLEITPPARGKRAPARLAYLAELARFIADDRAVLDLASRWQPVSRPAFAWARQLGDGQLGGLLDAHPLKRVGGNEGWLYTPARWESLQTTLLATLAERHASHPDEIGVARSALRRISLPKEPTDAADQAIGELIGSGGILNARGWLHLPEHRVSFNAEEEELWTRAVVLLQRDEGGWVRDVAQELGEDESVVRALLKKAARQGLTVAVVSDRYFAQERMRQIAATVRRLAGEHGFVEASGLRDALGLGRKLAIQILEFFDRCGFTRRLGNRHWLRDATLFES